MAIPEIATIEFNHLADLLLNLGAKSLFNRWKRWGDKVVFARMMVGNASEAAVPKTVLIDATYRKGQGIASSLRSQKGDQTTSVAA